MKCEKCGMEIENKDLKIDSNDKIRPTQGHEESDPLRKFHFGERIEKALKIMAKFVDDVLRSFNSQMISPYIKYRMRALQTLISLVLITVVISAVLSYLGVITGEAFTFLIGIVLGFILASMNRILGPA
ncbi:MAG: hypothetical protein QW520_08290 [Methanomassiliicoccales archaeon]